MQLFIVPPANEKQVSNNCVWLSETDEQFADGFLQVSNGVWLSETDEQFADGFFMAFRNRRAVCKWILSSAMPSGY